MKEILGALVYERVVSALVPTRHEEDWRIHTPTPEEMQDTYKRLRRIHTKTVKGTRYLDRKLHGNRPA